MSKKRKKVKRNFLSFFIGGSILSILFTGAELVRNTEIIAEVPWDVRNELYYDDILEDQPFFDSYGRYTSLGVPMKKATETDYLVDKFVTYDALEKLESVEIHMQNVDNLDFINKCPNLKDIYINEAEFLTEDDIDKINNSNIKKVVLSFNTDNIKKIRENKFDVSRFDKEVVINNCFFSYKEDLDQLTFYNYLTNFNDNMFADKQNLLLIKKMDNYLNNVIVNYKINEVNDDKEKIIRIADYICSNLHYDEEISDSIKSYEKTLEVNDKASYNYSEKTTNYNNHSISSVIYQSEEEKNGVCINYASLFDILCYKVGVKSRLVDGIETDLKIGHAWNVVYLDEEKDYVDLTFYDNNYKSNLLNKYCDTKDEFCYDLINLGLFKNPTTDHVNFNLFTDLDELDKPEEKKYIYSFNENLDGFYMVNDDLNTKGFLITFIAGGIIGININKKKKKIKKLLKTS